MDLVYVYVSDETQPHLQRRSQSPYDTLHLVFRHIADEHVLDVISVTIVKEDKGKSLSINTLESESF